MSARDVTAKITAEDRFTPAAKESLAKLADLTTRLDAITAAAKADAATMGLDLDNLRAGCWLHDSEDGCFCTDEEIDAWRGNFIESARLAYDIMAPIIVKAARRQVCREEGHHEIETTTLGATELSWRCNRCHEHGGRAFAPERHR